MSGPSGLASPHRHGQEIGPAGNRGTMLTTRELTPMPSAVEPADSSSVVLLADDNERVRRGFARALRNHGCEVIEAGDGLEALAGAMLKVPHVAIIDLHMPRLDGARVVAELKRRHGAALPVLVLSGMDHLTHRIQAFDVGADDFIPKPVYIRELLKRVDAFERTRRALIAAQIANQRADRLRLFATEAAALLAHDLNNGLSAATTNLSFLHEVIVPRAADDDVVAALEAAIHALRRMKGLVSNFVDVTRLEEDAITPKRQQVDLGELLGQVAAIHEPRRCPGGHALAIVAPDDLLVPLDPTLIERVIHNLLSNATRYVDAGGRIQITASRHADELVIAVANTGRPVPSPLREDLFEKYRTGADGKAQHGMGLYFCRLACEAHGGSIELTETAEFSTAFVIRLPVAS